MASTLTVPRPDDRLWDRVPPPVTRAGRWLSTEAAAVIAHYASLVLAYLGLWVLLLGTWFHGDDFEFLANRVGADTHLDIWAAHVEHWSTAPILVWKVLYAAFGIQSAAPYFAASLLVHVLSGHMLWRLMRRAAVPTWLATGLAASFLVMGAGWDDITWAFQLGFLGSLVLGLASLLLLLRRSVAAYLLAVLLSVVGLTFSGISITFAIAGALTLLVGRQRLRAVVLAVVTGGVYLTWYALNRDNIAPPAHGSSTAQRLSAAPRWAWQLLASSYETYTALIGAGTVLAIGLVVWFLWRLGDDATQWRLPVDDPRRQRFAALTVVTATALLQTASFAVNRNDISTPDTSRYLYFVIGLSLPLIGVVLNNLARTPWRSVLVGLFVVYLVVEQGLLLFAEERQYEDPQLQADTLGLAALIHSGAPVESVALAVDVNTGSVTKWVDEGALGSLDDVPAQSVLDASAIAQVATYPDRPANTTAGDVRTAGADSALPGGTCVTVAVTPGSVAATVLLSPGQTASVTLDDPASLVYRVVSGADRSRNVGVEVPVNGTRWLTTEVPLQLEVVADAGQDLTLCTP